MLFRSLSTKLLAPAIRHLRRLGIRLSVYIDDIIVLARSISQSVLHTQQTVNLLHHLGFSVHPEKCNLVPLRSQEFLSTQVNSKKMQFWVPREKLRSVRREIFAAFDKNDRHLLRYDTSQVCSASSMLFAAQSSSLSSIFGPSII